MIRPTQPIATEPLVFFWGFLAYVQLLSFTVQERFNSIEFTHVRSVCHVIKILHVKQQFPSSQLKFNYCYEI